jgi:hypothetical protein
MVVAAIWFGCNNVARDIVGEWTVFQRERMVSLKLPSYVFSKLAVAAVICFFQCLTLLGIVFLMCHLQASFWATFAVLYLSSLVGAALGLCVSARSSTTEAAIAMLPLILLPIITLGGGITPPGRMPGPMPAIAKIFPSRWAVEADLLLEAEKHNHAIYTSEATGPDGAPLPPFTEENDPEQHGCDLAEVQFPKLHTECITPAPDPKFPPKHDRPELSTSFAVLGGMLVFWTATALVFLRMRDIQ